MRALVPCVFCQGPDTDTTISLNFKQVVKRQFLLFFGYRLDVAYATFHYPCHSKCSKKFRFKRAFGRPLRVFAIGSCFVAIPSILLGLSNSAEIDWASGVLSGVVVSFALAVIWRIMFGYYMDRYYLKELEDCIKKWKASIQKVYIEPPYLKGFGFYISGVRTETYG